MNLKNAKSYFAEDLSIADYYGENARVQGEWLGKGAARLGLIGVDMKGLVVITALGMFW